MDNESLSHTKWNCKYHVVFAPKYRRKIIYGKLKVEIGRILRDLCARKGIEIIEAEACPDHIHMLLSIPPKFSVSSVMGYLKGEEQPYDIRQVCESEVPLRQQGVLVSWVLRRHRGTEQGGGGAVHKEPAGGGQGWRAAGDERAVRPVHG